MTSPGDHPVDQPAPHFLGTAPAGDLADAMYAEDREDLGYVMNVTRLWAHQPEVISGLFHLMGVAARAAGLTVRERGVLVTAMASTLGDSYCSLAWSSKMCGLGDGDAATSVLRGDDVSLSVPERAMAAWARRIVRDPAATTPGDVDALRGAGLSDQQILAVTTFVALRLAFSTVNGALGALPDPELRSALPDDVVGLVTYGRPIAAVTSAEGAR